MLKKVVASGLIIGTGVGVAGYIAYSNRLRANASVGPTEFHEQQQAQIQQILQSPASFEKAAPFIFYRYTTCPFCCKLQAFMDYHKLNYDIVEVNPLTKKEIQSHGYLKVPQLQLGKEGPLLVDSDLIVEMLDSVVNDNPEKNKTEDVSKWRKWAREELVRYMVLNTNRTIFESFLGYNYVDNISSFSTIDKWLLKFSGGPIMFFVSNVMTKKKLVRGYGYDGKDPRAALYQNIDQWVNEGLYQKELHGGSQPDLADLDIYGIIQSQRFLPVFNDLLENTNPRFSEWIARMDSFMPTSYKL